MARLVIVLVALSGVHRALSGCLQLATSSGTTTTTSLVLSTCSNVPRAVGDCFGTTEAAWKERYTALSTAFGGACAADFLCGHGLNCYGPNATCPNAGVGSNVIPPRLCCAAFERCGKTQITLPNGVTVGRGEFCKQLGDNCPLCPVGQVLCLSTGCIDPTTTTCADGPVLSKPLSGAGTTGETLRRDVIATCKLNDSTLFDTNGQPVAGALEALRTKLATLPYNCPCVVQKALRALQQLAVTTDPFVSVLNTLAQAGQCTLNTDQAQQEISKVRKACPAPFIFSEMDNSCVTPQPVNGACPEPLVLSQSACTIPAARTVGTAKVCSPPLVVNSSGGCSSPPTINPNARAGRCPSAASSGTTCTADQDCASPMKCCNGNCATPVAPTPPASGVSLPTIPDSTRTCIMIKNVGEVVSTTSDAPVSTLSTMCQANLPAQTTTPAPPRHPCQDYASRCTSSATAGTTTSTATDFKACFANLLSTNVIPTNSFCAKWVRNNPSAEPCSTYVDDASKCKKDTPSATFECLKANFASLPTLCQQKVQTVIDDMPCDSYFSKYCSSYTKLYDKVNCLRAVIDASADASIVSQTCQTLLSFSAACSWERVSLCQDAAPNADSIRSCLLAAPTTQLSTSCASLVATIKQNEATIATSTARGFAPQQTSNDIGCGTSSGVVQNSCTSISGSSAGVTTTTTPSTPSTGTTPPTKVSAAGTSAPMYILAILAMAFAVLI